MTSPTTSTWARSKCGMVKYIECPFNLSADI
jgi:hypothetical protein